MAVDLSVVVPTQVVSTDFKRGVFDVTFDSSYPTGGETVDFSAYGFTSITDIDVVNNVNGYGVKLSATESGGLFTASTAKLKVMLNQPLEVSGTVAHDVTLFDAAATSDSAVLFAQPAGANITGIELGIGAKFVATSMTNIVVTVGDGSDVDGYSAATLDLVADDVGDVDTTKGVLFVPTVYLQAAQNWTATATATGANFSTTSAGSMTWSYWYYPETGDGCVGGPGISEVPNTTDLSTVSFTITVNGI